MKREDAWRRIGAEQAKELSGMRKRKGPGGFGTEELKSLVGSDEEEGTG